jgi:hypothetical protein
LSRSQVREERKVRARLCLIAGITAKLRSCHLGFSCGYVIGRGHMVSVQSQACEEASKTTAQTLNGIVRVISQPKEMPSCTIERSAKIEVYQRHLRRDCKAIRALLCATKVTPLKPVSE